MKLVTENGILSLPEDFSFTMELNNPMLSDDGDATIPATIPSSPENLKVLKHDNRIDRAQRYMRSIPAILTSGVFQKSGQLLIDMASKYNGVSVALAVENSDVYIQNKDKSLKEIFANKIRDDWSGSVQSLAEYLTNIFYCLSTDDFAVFTIAIAAFDENDEKIYQYNNERGKVGLLWESRVVHEGDYNMGVPDGYGLSPFLYLHRLVSLLFEEMGYQVHYNCLSKSPFNDIVVLNNCADTIVKGKINYSHIVPSCTLKEFIEFLFNKFGVHVRVNSTAKTVEVIMLQELLAEQAECDVDISNKVLDGMDVYIEDSSRVVLSSEVSMDDTEPATETLDALIEKYGSYIEVNESEFQAIATNTNPKYYDCLILRKDLGYFYELLRHIGTGQQSIRFVGTNNFKYDRKNSKKTEDHSASDVIPQMIMTQYFPVLYVGDRYHYNTTFNNAEDSESQSIMIAWGVKFRYNSVFYSFGTTQKYLFGSQVKPFSLNPYEMYDYFWSNYNNILLNNKVTFKGKVGYDVAELVSLDMTKMKYCKGQRLFPVKSSFDIGKKLKVGESEFILVKNFSDMVADEPIVTTPIEKLKWVIHENIEQEVQAWAQSCFPIYQYHDDAHGQWIQYEHTGDEFGWPPDEALLLGGQIQYLKFKNVEIEYLGGDAQAYIGPPHEYGEHSYKFNVNYNVKVNYDVWVWNDEGFDVHRWEYWALQTIEWSGQTLNYFIAQYY